MGHPPSKFQRVFDKAREMGLKLVAHAGEEGPPEYVWEAVDGLKVDRIDHGNRSLEDPELVEKLVHMQIPLTVCPQSNLRLAVIKDMADHPIRKMLGLGLKATVNSDDPAYFGGYVNDNYKALVDAVDLQHEEILTLVRNGFDSAFIPEDAKRKHMQRLDQARTQ
jgi:adenosine deaminase